MAMFTVALTGGIASGKNMVSTRFQQHGIDVFDADMVARELVAPGQPALDEIKNYFGSNIITDEGKLDRKRMREHIFYNHEARQHLEKILHPRIRQSLQHSSQQSTTPYCVLTIPLLAECFHDYRWVNRVLVVDVPEFLQIERLIQRDSVEHDLAKRMLTSQAPREARLTIADDIIENTGSIEALSATVDKLHARYLQLAVA